MFGWLLRKLRRKPPPTIRTFDDLTAALQSGAIQPHVRREGEVQVVDPFAETGLSPIERKKVMLRSFGFPAGIRMYVHRHCASAYLEQRVAHGETHFPPHTEEWSPVDLIGRFRDVTRCDHCGREFLPADEGYIAYWMVSREDLQLWEEVQREQPPEGRASAEPTPES
jgi:hypothetical protein